MVVVLPAPFGPRKPNSSWRWTWNEISSTATVPSKTLRRPAASMTVSISIPSLPPR